MTIELLAFAGSTRTGSLNKLLVQNAAKTARQQGATVNVIDLRDYPMPLFDGDLEKDRGLPDNAIALTRLMTNHHGFIVGCPEYNSAITAVLKNAIDWVSRPQPNVPSLAAFSGKTAALLAASPGSLGGLRSLASVRSILSNLGMIVVPKQYALGNASAAFDDKGRLINENASKSVSALVEQLIRVTTAMHRDSSQES